MRFACNSGLNIAANRDQQTADQHAEFQSHARHLVDDVVRLVQVGFVVNVDARPIFGRVPMQEMLAPAYLFAGDKQARQRRDDGNGEREGRSAHERVEQELNSNEQGRDHDEKLAE